MIASFGSRDTQKLSEGIRVQKFQPFERMALRKLRQLQAATSLEDLRIPPGNKLELLRGNHRGQYSIRIKDQYRICFSWVNGYAYKVEIVDYH